MICKRQERDVRLVVWLWVWLFGGSVSTVAKRTLGEGENLAMPMRSWIS